MRHAKTEAKFRWQALIVPDATSARTFREPPRCKAALVRKSLPERRAATNNVRATSTGAPQLIAGSHARRPLRAQHKSDPGRSRTCNLCFRRPTPYPLGGHRAFASAPSGCTGMRSTAEMRLTKRMVADALPQRCEHNAFARATAPHKQPYTRLQAITKAPRSDGHANHTEATSKCTIPPEQPQSHS